MNPEDDDDLEAMTEEYGDPGPFVPVPHYCPHGDMIRVFFDDVSYYARSLPHGLAIFYERGTDRVVGCQVASIKRLMEGRTLPATMFGD